MAGRKLMWQVTLVPMAIQLTAGSEAGHNPGRISAKSCAGSSIRMLPVWVYYPPFTIHLMQVLPFPAIPLPPSGLFLTTTIPTSLDEKRSYT